MATTKRTTASQATFGSDADFRDDATLASAAMTHTTHNDPTNGMTSFLDLDSDSSGSSGQPSPLEHPTPLQPPPKKIGFREPANFTNNSSSSTQDFFPSNAKSMLEVSDATDGSAMVMASPSTEVPPSVGNTVRAMLDVNKDSSNESLSPPDLVMSSGSEPNSSSNSEKSRTTPDLFDRPTEDLEPISAFQDEIVTESPQTENGPLDEKEVVAPGSPGHLELESLLRSVSRSDKACVLRPSRGPFKAHLVALIACGPQGPSQHGSQNMPNNGAADDTTSKVLLPLEGDDAESCAAHVQKIRTAMKEWGGDHSQPDLWIPLRSMPAAPSESSGTDTTQMQQWLETVDSKAEELIMSMQATEQKPRPLSSLQTTKRKPLPEPDRLSMLLMDNAADIGDERQSTVMEPTEDLTKFPLSAIQQLFFRASMNRANVGNSEGPGQRFSQSILLEVSKDVDSTDIESSLEALVTRHSMLRARFKVTGDSLSQVVLPDAAKSYRFGHRHASSDADILRLIEKSQASINIITGPVFAADHIHTPDGRELLYLVAHHLVVDVASWKILVHDLDELLQRGRLVSGSSVSFPDWINYQLYENSHRLTRPALPFDITPLDLDYWGLEKQHNTYGDTVRHMFSLPADLTRSLQTRCNRVFRTETADIFLTALLLSFHQTFSDRGAPTIWKQEHGRESHTRDFNITETVGWFTSLCPITASVDTSTDFIALLKLMKDTRRAIPRHGIPYFNSEFASAQTELASLPVEIMFNCLESIPQLHRSGGLLQPTPPPDHEVKSLRSDIGPEVGRIALFEISVVMDTDGAHVEAFYSPTKHQARTEEWLTKFEEILVDSAFRLKAMDPQLTLADTPLIKTSYKGLAKLGSELLEELGIDSMDEIETVLPINPMQQEILIAQSQDVNNYHVRSVYELTTPNNQLVDQGRICDAWSTLVCKHVALRSIFIDGISETGLFDQLVLKKISPNMLFFDSADIEDTLASLPAMKVSRGQPRHRLSVIRSARRTLICLDASQAILDSLSLVNLVTQLGKLYAGDSVHVDCALLTTYLYRIAAQPPNVSQAMTRDLWDAKPCLLPLLNDDSEPAPESQVYELDITRKKLNDFCRYQEIEPNVVLQLAWALVLRIYVGTNQVTFGCEMPGRDEDSLPGVSGAIGSFSSVSPCKVDLDPKRTIRQCLKNLGLFSASMTGRQDLITSRVEHALDLKGQPLYNTCLSFQYSSAVPEWNANGFAASLWSSASTMDTLFSLHSAFLGDKLHATVSSHDISAYQIRNTIRSFEQALRTIIECPTQLVSDVDLFTDRDYAHLALQGWEAGEELVKPEQCLHQIILQHARNRPNSMAVAAEDGGMTYHQMSKFVSSLSVYLVNLGVRPGVIVPVVLEKSWWAPIIILGVMQAGGAFVCLDDHDREVFEATIRQLNPQIVITGESAWSGLNVLTPNVVVVNNSFFSALPPQLSIAAQSPTPQHAACVLYSPAAKKAAPRSIFYTHSSLSMAFMAQGQALKMNENSRVLQLSAFNNDIALAEILGTMFHGGCVCIPAPHERGHQLEKAIVRMNVSWTYMTSVLVRKVTPRNVPSLRTICFRTRKLEDDIRETWVGKVNVLLAYGAPDVCPLSISVSEVTNEKKTAVIPAPLMGKYWILNPENPKKLMPVGAIGELAIDSPDLTPHKFTPGGSLVVARNDGSSDHADKPRPRSLRTGHRVRYLDNGSIEFLSSIRDEITIAGKPVPTTEVENRLRKCLGKNVDVALEAVTTSDRRQVLVAFLELRDDAQRGPHDFEKISMPGDKRASLVQKLVENPSGSSSGVVPPHQRILKSHLPSVFIPLKTFPLSSSLKVNRRKLQKIVSFMSYNQLLEMSTTPNPAELGGSSLSDKPLPLTRIEQKMRDIWAGVLSMTPADINNQDTFPGLGGSRHQAAELVKACREAEFPISVKDVISGKSLSELSQPFNEPEPAEEESSMSSNTQQIRNNSSSRASPVPSKAPSKVAGLPEIFIKEVIAPQLKEYRHNIADAAEASPHQVRDLEGHLYKVKANLRWLVLNFNGPVRYQKLEAACMALSNLHPILRTAFAVHERRVYQVRVDSFRPEFTRRTCSLADISNEVKRIADYDQAAGYKLREPITRFYFLDAVHQGTLVMRLSTSQVDDHSISHLVQDLTALFKNPSANLRRFSFFDYVRTVKFTNHQDGLNFWKQQLDGAWMTQVVSHSKPPAPTNQVKRLTKTLKVESLAEFGLSFDTVLKTAWGIMLATLSGSSDILFGEAIHGQNVSRPKNVDINAMVGPVTNIIPVRIRFPAVHTTPLEIMQAVQEQRVSSRPYEAIGGLELIEKCTDWSYWTRFSTVVEHRPQALVDGLTTLNMGNTTFRYTVIEPEAMNIPDLRAQTTMDGPEKVDLEITYSESRVSKSLANNALMLLATNIEMLTRRDPISKPLLKPADQMALSAPRIPVPQRKPVARKASDSSLWIDDERRVQLQNLIQDSWNEHVNPLAMGVAESEVHKTRFYEVWGSLLPATFFADHLNRELPKIGIKGTGHLIHFTAEEMIDNPTMQDQYDLIVTKMREAGVVTEPAKKVGGNISASSAVEPWGMATPTSADGPLAWKKSVRKFRNLESRPSVRDLGNKASEYSNKASGWMRHKVSNSHDGFTSLGSFRREREQQPPQDDASPQRAERLSLDSRSRNSSRLSLLNPTRQRSASPAPSAKETTKNEGTGFGTSNLSLRSFRDQFAPIVRSGSLRSQKASKRGTSPSPAPPAASASTSDLTRSNSLKSRPLIPKRAVSPSPRPLPSIPSGASNASPLGIPNNPFPRQAPAPLPLSSYNTSPRRSSDNASPSSHLNSSRTMRNNSLLTRVDSPSNNNRILEPIAEPIELGSREITRSRLEQLRIDPTDGLVTGPDGMIIAELETPLTANAAIEEEEMVAAAAAAAAKEAAPEPSREAAVVEMPEQEETDGEIRIALQDDKPVQSHA